ncbi:GNAT family N-acetyltransferase [Roseobacter sp. CCS2]|uniref:GNAT family N-acetyltransferase n=1 Tax=Roseobacter sp. CCS2 TaxID=391593 RepID=UPI0000F3E540|nr:GNAT family N-acetyltransferase [Roseobacter sp. CCS2]EBA12413.1 hypothetical protein RCCS2_13989 [Roseobacter sp. CCS2]
MAETITLRHLGPADLKILLGVKEGLFDHAIRPDQAEAFLADPLHEIVLAFDKAEVVGMASGQVMLHPDKAPAFFIAEVGVRDAYLRQGIAKRMCVRLCDVARARGCDAIWLATEESNAPARALYQSLDARAVQGVVVYDWKDAMDA